MLILIANYIFRYSFQNLNTFFAWSMGDFFFIILYLYYNFFQAWFCILLSKFRKTALNAKVIIRFEAFLFINCKQLFMIELRNPFQRSLQLNKPIYI